MQQCNAQHMWSKQKHSSMMDNSNWDTITNLLPNIVRRRLRRIETSAQLKHRQHKNSFWNVELHELSSYVFISLNYNRDILNDLQIFYLSTYMCKHLILKRYRKTILQIAIWCPRAILIREQLLYTDPYKMPSEQE